MRADGRTSTEGAREEVAAKVANLYRIIHTLGDHSGGNIVGVNFILLLSLPFFLSTYFFLTIDHVYSPSMQHTTQVLNHTTSRRSEMTVRCAYISFLPLEVFCELIRLM